MIKTTNLTFAYNPQTIFRFPDLFCQQKESLLITGNSGKGKTTLLHLLGGLLRPTGGDIEIDGTQLGGLSDNQLDRFRGNNIGMVLQDSHFVASLSVLENISLAAWLSTGKRADDKAMKLLSELQLADQASKYTSALSIGQKQRVSIARALINEPKLLLADEPTSSLDDENALIVANLLQSLSAEYGAALVIVTHDHRLKEKFPNSVAL